MSKKYKQEASTDILGFLDLFSDDLPDIKKYVDEDELSLAEDLLIDLFNHLGAVLANLRER